MGDTCLLFFCLIPFRLLRSKGKRWLTINDGITELLDLSDDDSEIIDSHTEGHTKYVTLQKKLIPKYCPYCHSRLHSKGTFQRHPNNPVLQDGYELKLTLIGRRWECPNKDICNYSETDEFNFIEANKKNTKIVPLMVINEMKDLHLSCRQVAARFNVSDTYVHEIFMRYVSLPRLPLTSCISIDEVYVNIAPEFKYALVIMDFPTSTILDILPSRREKTTAQYFMSIPKKERDGVRYLICDMYNPYINYTQRYFHDSIAIVDSFHVLQWLENLIGRYINDVKKRYQDRDRKVLEDRSYTHNHDFETQKDSQEVYILKNAKWVLLMRKDRIKYSGRHYNHFLNQYLDAYDWQKMFLSLDPAFDKIRFYKDMYEEFNSSWVNDKDEASEHLEELINVYSNCDIKIFREFSNLLSHYHDQIINSFTFVSGAEALSNSETLRRLSNGPMESFNNNPSSLRTQSHGVKNFEYTRNRILWAMRDNPPVHIVPKTAEDVHTYTQKKRGSYNRTK